MQERAILCCPFCKDKDHVASVAIQMGVVYVLRHGCQPREHEKIDTESYFEYSCKRCNYREIHDYLIYLDKEDDKPHHRRPRPKKKQ